MMNQLLDITTGTIDWSRTIALTAIYHWLFVPLTLGLAVIMGIMETCYYRKKKRFWKDAARFCKTFGVNFAMGVATGIILEFEFGTNWSNYSWFVGDIFGAPLAIEGIIAFFMESTFVAVMFFGWKKVSAGFHLASTWLTGLVQRFRLGGFWLPIPGCNILWDVNSIQIQCVTRWCRLRMSLCRLRSRQILSHGYFGVDYRCHLHGCCQCILSVEKT